MANYIKVDSRVVLTHFWVDHPTFFKSYASTDRSHDQYPEEVKEAFKGWVDRYYENGKISASTKAQCRLEV